MKTLYSRRASCTHDKQEQTMKIAILRDEDLQIYRSFVISLRQPTSANDDISPHMAAVSWILWKASKRRHTLYNLSWSHVRYYLMFSFNLDLFSSIYSQQASSVTYSAHATIYCRRCYLMVTSAPSPASSSAFAPFQ